MELHQSDAASSDTRSDLRLHAILGDPGTDDDASFTEMKARAAPLNPAQGYVISNAVVNLSGQFTHPVARAEEVPVLKTRRDHLSRKQGRS